ncbi:MAG: hypothetical protein IKE36_03535 [Solobacterium sp.]|nr:hypothetical protein [Solobacterium sp.]
MSTKSSFSSPAVLYFGIDGFREILTQYFPKTAEELASGKQIMVRFNELLDTLDLDTQKKVYDILEQKFIDFQKIFLEEAREFDPDVDLSDDRYLWGPGDQKERCVRRIEEIYQGRTGEIIFYGPSNITYWYSLEKDMEPWKAQNHGMGGCTDPDMIQYAERLLYPFKPRAVLFQTGSNDLAMGMTPLQILHNKEKMYAEFLANMPQADLIIMSGLPLPNRTIFWKDTVKTNEYLKEMCDKHERLHFLDASEKMLTDHGEDRYRMYDGSYANPALFRADGIHLNVKGHEVWTALQKQMLKDLGI